MVHCVSRPAGGSNKRGHFLLFFLFWIVSETHNWKEWIQNSKAGPWGIPSHDSCMRSCLRKYPWVVQSWLVLVSREYLLNTNTEEIFHTYQSHWKCVSQHHLYCYELEVLHKFIYLLFLGTYKKQKNNENIRYLIIKLCKYLLIFWNPDIKRKKKPALVKWFYIIIRTYWF